MKMLRLALWVGVLGAGLVSGCAAGSATDGEDVLPIGGEGGSGGSDAGAGGTTSPAGSGGSSAGSGGSNAGAGGSGAGAGGSGAGQGGSSAGSGGSEAGSGGTAAGSGGSDAGSGGTGGSAGAGGSAGGCGDGKKGDKEQCDGADLGGQTCGTVLDPTYGGKLGCKANCQFDFSGCAKNPVCGDGAINVTGEECDDSDFGGKTCAKVLNNPNASGVLTCTKECKVDASGCKQGPFCGDGKKGDNEDCDGDDLGTATCATATGDPNKGGLLACKADCKLDTTGCVDNPKCGDGKVNNAGEQCDGGDLVGATCKSALGNVNATGTLACKADCQLDTSGCTVPPFCGDGKVNNAGEACDGLDLGGATCASLLGQGHEGQLVCSPDCTISTSKCEKVPFCGDGVKNGSDACDGSDLGGATCASVVGSGSEGGLACKADCTFDVGACSIPSSCGNGTIDADKGEQCDGNLFGGKTCATILGDSKAVGSLVCTGACTIDASGCTIPPYCGDGKLNQASEECDDGNTTNGDGCNSSCKVVCLGSEKKFGVNCYVDSWTFPSDEYRTWDDASAFCVGGGGHLVSISSKAENDFVYLDVMPSGLLDPTSPRWIGLNDKSTEGSFVWSSGEPLTYTNWRSGEPNDSGGNEDCVEQRWSDGKWNDNNCTQTRLFICEYPPPVLYP